MLKKLLKASVIQDVVAFLASLYIRFIFLTTRWQFINFHIPAGYLKEKRSFITCFWHSRLLMLPYCWVKKDHPFYMLISAHKDGRIISKTVAHFKIKTIPGSTERGGTEALLKMIRHSRQRSILGITPDGPRGPAAQVSKGTAMVSYLSKADLIPVTYTVSRKKILKTWDRFLLPLPFGKGTIMWGEPLSFPAEKKLILATQERLKQSLDALNEAAENTL